MFSSTGEYALRALIYLAALPEGEAALGRSIAEHACVPRNYLSKILHALRNEGYLETARGTGGGYRLRRPAAEIRIMDVAELFEGPRARLGCFLGNARECTDERPCSAHEGWKQIRNRYVDFMESTTLSDLAEGASGLHQTLPGAPPAVITEPSRGARKRAAATSPRGRRSS